MAYTTCHAGDGQHPGLALNYSYCWRLSNW